MAARCRRGGGAGPSVLEGYQTTVLPEHMEMFAWTLTKRLSRVMATDYSPRRLGRGEARGTRA